MSDSKMLDRYMTAEQRPGAHETDGTDDLLAFGWLRGIRDRSLMLELRKKDGSIRAVGYAWLEQAEFDPSGVITLTVGGQKIRLKGRNLNLEVRPTVRLFEGLTRHRVPWVREGNRAAVLAATGDVAFIEAIEW